MQVDATPGFCPMQTPDSATGPSDRFPLQRTPTTCTLAKPMIHGRYECSVNNCGVTRTLRVCGDARVATGGRGSVVARRSAEVQPWAKTVRNGPTKCEVYLPRAVCSFHSAHACLGAVWVVLAASVDAEGMVVGEDGNGAWHEGGVRTRGGDGRSRRCRTGVDACAWRCNSGGALLVWLEGMAMTRCVLCCRFPDAQGDCESHQGEGSAEAALVLPDVREAVSR